MGGTIRVRGGGGRALTSWSPWDRCWSRCRAGSIHRRSPRACSRSRATTCSVAHVVSCIWRTSSTGAAGPPRGPTPPRLPGSLGSRSRCRPDRREFDERVIGDFIGEHEAGRTPNPCARCSGEIKFGAFSAGRPPWGSTSSRPVTTFGRGAKVGAMAPACRAPTPGKDRYMLHARPAQLGRSMFPVGGMSKGERPGARGALGLPVATKPDSQELYFAPTGDAGGFVRSAAPELVQAGGAVVDAGGGCWASMTARSPLRSGSAGAWGWRGGPAVVAVDAGANRVVVGPRSC